MTIEAFSWLCSGRLVLLGWLVFFLGGGAIRAQVPVRVVPGQTTLVGGETWPFKAVAPGGGEQNCRWTVVEAEGGTVQPGSGTYVAPLVEAVARFHVRAASPDDPRVFGEAVVTVLPRGLLVRQGQGGSAEAFPFLLPGVSRRFGENQTVRSWFPPEPLAPSPRIIAGYGLPVTLRWNTVAGTEAELLSYREGDELRCLEVTGREEVTLCLRGLVSNCGLEALRHGYGPCPGWKSLLRRFNLGVRGMVAFVGDPGAEPGFAEGQGRAVGFREPVGLAMLGGGLHCPARLIVADAGSHMIRAVSREGAADGNWGKDGEKGYQDGSPDQARFDSPSFVAVNRYYETPDPYQYCYGFVVSDTGNQVLRKVDHEGRVGTLAGQPGQPGYLDADDPHQARFSRPQGVVMDGAGNVFVADQGNHVLRRIARGGQVTTLAGKAGVPGHEDGSGAQARFSRLGGLTEGGDGHLYVVDGHALRRVTKDGAVTTVLGVPDQPGFRDDAEAMAGLAPCLRDPGGVAAAWKQLYLADTGNHALRVFDLSTGSLRTLAGDPRAPEPRFGLLRDGLEGPLAPAYAALAAPRGVAAGPCGDVYVATGPGVVRICRQNLPGPDALAAPSLRVAKATVGEGEGLRVLFFVPTKPEGQGAGRAIHYEVAFLNADGSLADHKAGSGEGDRWVACQGAFTQPGEGVVRLRCVTDQGVSFGARRTVQVVRSGDPAPPGRSGPGPIPPGSGRTAANPPNGRGPSSRSGDTPRNACPSF